MGAQGCLKKVRAAVMRFASRLTKKPNIDEALEASERELAEERRRLEGKDEQIAQVRRSIREHQEVCEQRSERPEASIESLQRQLVSQRKLHADEMARQRAELLQ